MAVARASVGKKAGRKHVYLEVLSRDRLTGGALVDTHGRQASNTVTYRLLRYGAQRLDAMDIDFLLE